MPLPWSCSCPTVGTQRKLPALAGNFLDGTETYNDMDVVMGGARIRF